MLKLRALIVFAVALSVLQVRNSSADTVYSDFGTSNSYNTTAGWSVGGPFFSAFTYEDAMSFTPTKTFSFVAADLALSLVGSNHSITVTLADNLSGAPSATLESFTTFTAPGTSNPVTWQQFGSANAIAQANSVTHPTLDSGETYWLIVSANANTLASWGDNNQGDNGGWQNLNGTWSDLKIIPPPRSASPARNSRRSPNPPRSPCSAPACWRSSDSVSCASARPRSAPPDPRSYPSRISAPREAAAPLHFRSKSLQWNP